MRTVRYDVVTLYRIYLDLILRILTYAVVGLEASVGYDFLFLQGQYWQVRDIAQDLHRKLRPHWQPHCSKQRSKSACWNKTIS